MLAVVWWVLFTAVMLWAQTLLPGVCLLTSGFILSLQQEDRLRTFWLAVFWILVQEGCGSMAFGYMVLWFSILFFLFFLGQRLFDNKSHLFMIILGLASGVLHFFLIFLLTILESIPFRPDDVVGESILQAVIFPMLWLILDKIYPERLKKDERHL